MLKIFKQLKTREWFLIILSLGLICLQVWLDVRLPEYTAQLTRLVQTEGVEMSKVLIAGGWMLACAVGSLITSFLVGLFAALVATRVSKKLRSALFNKTMSFSMEEMNLFSTSSLITRSTNDITQVQMLIAMGMQAIIKAPILAIWAIASIANKGWEWSLATGIAVALMLAMLSVVIVFAIPKSTKIQKLTDNLNLITRENLTGVRVVRAYNAENYQEGKFDVANKELTKTHLFVSKIMAILEPGMTFIFSSLTLAIYMIGAIVIAKLTSPIAQVDKFGDMVAFTGLAMQVIMAFMLLSMIFIIYPRAAVSAKRINEVIYTDSKLSDGLLTNSDYEKNANVEGKIEFKDVSFSYPDATDNILHNINVTINKGETLAIIGSTGSGKTTLINLIPRFYDVTCGELLINNINVKDYRQADLRDIIGYVSQKAVLFSGTISSNITLGKEDDTNTDEIDNAINISQSREFVDKVEGGIDYAIAQGGSNLSGGQKQRISIARAICKKPQILIFDDSFSALDYKTDKKLRQELNKATNKGITKIIVAQRIGTIKDANKILVINDGSIVGLGTHRELLKNCTEYQEIAYSQLSQEELDNE